MFGAGTTDSSQRGMTLLEVLVVLGVLGLLLGALSVGISRVRRSDLRRDAVRVVAALKSAFDRAAASGAHHRVVLDLDEETFRVERCEGKMRLARSIDEGKERREEEILAQQEEIRRQLEAAAQAAMAAGATAGATPPAPGASSPTGIGASAAPSVAVEGAVPTVGTTACAPVKGELGVVQPLRKSRGVGLRRVWVAHREGPIEGGIAEIHFFSLGFAERAVVEIADDADGVFTILVHPVSGRVELLDGEFRKPDDFVGRDAEGKELAP